MKKLMATLLTAVTLLVFSAYKEAEQQADDLFKLLGIPETEAMQTMKENLLYASLNAPFSAKYKNIPGSKKAAIVQQLGNYMKQYFKKPEVAADYAAYRESLMPGRQEGIDVKARIEEIKNDIKKTEADKKAAPAGMQQLYDETIAQLKKELEVLQNPSHPEYRMYTGAVELTPEQQEAISRQVTEFSREYPAGVQQYLKLKLQAFLETTADIDFGAKLVQRSGKWKFENPAYEAKDYNWKKCFRAGKETIEAARAFAQQWIKEIQ